jgi:L-amino acid N-acyltransferase YncA
LPYNLHERVVKIRPATDADRGAIWKIFHEVVAAGDTYAIDPNILHADAFAYWFRSDTHTFVAEQHAESAGEGAPLAKGFGVGFPGTAAPSPAVDAPDHRVVGTYILRPNQSGGGSHVANAAFMVANEARGQGVGRAMGEHCLSEARRLGFRAIQFNFVVSTNESAIRLWRELGFEIVGTLPGAFRHPEKGYVDVYVMFQSLSPANDANQR